MGFESGSFNNNEEITSKTEKTEKEYTGTSEEYNYLKHISRYTWEQLQEAKNKKEVNSEEVNKLQTLLNDLNTQQEKSWAKKEEKLEALDPAVKEEYKNIDNQIREWWRNEINERNRTGEILGSSPYSPFSSNLGKFKKLEQRRRELEQKHNL